MTKPENRKTFYSSRHGYVQLVKRSIGYYVDTIQQKEVSNINGASFYNWVDVVVRYWRGQLVTDWSGSIEETGESWSLHKGQVIWLNADNFSPISEHDYLSFTETKTE